MFNGMTNSILHKISIASIFQRVKENVVSEVI